MHKLVGMLFFKRDILEKIVEPDEASRDKTNRAAFRLLVLSLTFEALYLVATVFVYPTFPNTLGVFPFLLAIALASAIKVAFASAIKGPTVLVVIVLGLLGAFMIHVVIVSVIMGAWVWGLRFVNEIFDNGTLSSYGCFRLTGYVSVIFFIPGTLLFFLGVIILPSIGFRLIPQHFFFNTFFINSFPDLIFKLWALAVVARGYSLNGQRSFLGSIPDVILASGIAAGAGMMLTAMAISIIFIWPMIPALVGFVAAEGFLIYWTITLVTRRAKDGQAWT